MRRSLALIPLLLVLALAAVPAAATVSPANGKIVFQQRTPLPDGTATIQLFMINKDGSGLTQLTTSGVNSTPVWSPSGRFIAFVQSSSWTGQYALSVMDMKTGSVHSVVPGLCMSGPFDRPAWSPDGSQLIFDNYCPGSPSIWKVNVDGTGLEMIRSFPGGAVASPSWSPDGLKIVFSYDLLTTDRLPYRIFTVNANGSGLVRLTRNTGAGAYTPQYSPDGSKIVYVQDGGPGVLGINVMDADGTNVYAVSHFDRYSVVTPSWSPDGRWIVFASSEPACNGCAADSWDLFVTRADGSGGTRRLTLVPPQTADWFPTWQPRAAAI